jgi:microcystin-dependent protein
LAETQTPNYHWTLPDLGGDASNWGTVLNQTLTSIDSVVKNNETNLGLGSVPIGAVLDFFGAITPTNYLPCDGSTHNVSDYPTLGAMLAIGAASTFNTPNYGGKSGIGANATYTLGAIGGEATHVLTVGEMPVHAHSITQVAHTHTASQPAHVHPDPGHTHGVNDPQHFHSTVNTALGSGTNVQPGSGWNLNGTTTTDYKSTGITIQSAVTGLQAAGADPVTVNATTPSGPTATGNIGSGAAHNNLPPYVVCNKIIRAK